MSGGYCCIFRREWSHFVTYRFYADMPRITIWSRVKFSKVNRLSGSGSIFYSFEVHTNNTSCPHADASMRLEDLAGCMWNKACWRSACNQCDSEHGMSHDPHHGRQRMLMSNKLATNNSANKTKRVVATKQAIWLKARLLESSP